MHIDKEPRRVQCVENELPRMLIERRYKGIFGHRKAKLLQKELPQVFGFLDVVEPPPVVVEVIPDDGEIGPRGLDVMRTDAGTAEDVKNDCFGRQVARNFG